MASELKDTLNAAVKDAMRAKEKERLGVLRMVMAELKRIEVDERIELDDARVLAVLDKMVKQRRDAAQQYSDAGRPELADTETREIAVIQDFMPRQLSGEEIEAIVTNAIDQTGASGMADMGKVMGVVKPQVQGRADMGVVSRIVKSALS